MSTTFRENTTMLSILAWAHFCCFAGCSAESHGEFPPTIENRLHSAQIAISDYRDTNGEFPPVAICDAAGNPLLSWRALIVGYLNDGYNIALDRAWNAQENQQWHTPAPDGLAFPSTRGGQPGGIVVVALLDSDHNWIPISVNGRVTTSVRLVAVRQRTDEWLRPKEMTLEELHRELADPSSSRVVGWIDDSHIYHDNR